MLCSSARQRSFHVLPAEAKAAAERAHEFTPLPEINDCSDLLTILHEVAEPSSQMFAQGVGTASSNVIARR
jgi:hypothetical protein